MTPTIRALMLGPTAPSREMIQELCVPQKAGQTVSHTPGSITHRRTLIVWKLKEYVEHTHNLRTAVQLQLFIEEKVGVKVKVTVQTIRALLRGPAAPRGEMIQLLCDALNCRSDAFYIFNPNSTRSQQWAKQLAEGKAPSRLYEPKGAKTEDAVAEIAPPAIIDKDSGKRNSLRATFTDPRTLYDDELRS